MSSDKIKIGILFSQSGPMASPENSHLKGVLLACEEINSSGGIDGQLLDPIIMDPGGDDRRYSQMATELLIKHKVSVIFGCCLSSSRKAVIPIVERFNGILFYPAVYEGFEYSPNVIYGGGVPNQLVLPLLEYLYTHYGKKIGLIGSDYVFAREINRVVTEFSDESNGEIVAECYLPFESTEGELRTVLSQVLLNEPDVILSTVVGQDGVSLYKIYAEMNTDKRDDTEHVGVIPIASMTSSESDLAKLEEDSREGHLVVAPYFSSIQSQNNKKFVSAYKARFGEKEEPCAFSEVGYSLLNIFADAIHLAGKSDADSILAALSGAVFKSPGGNLFLDVDTNHFALRPYVAKSTIDGTFEILWKGDTVVRPDPYLIAYNRSLDDSITE